MNSQQKTKRKNSENVVFVAVNIYCCVWWCSVNINTAAYIIIIMINNHIFVIIILLLLVVARVIVIFSILHLGVKRQDLSHQQLDFTKDVYLKLFFSLMF